MAAGRWGRLALAHSRYPKPKRHLRASSSVWAWTMACSAFVLGCAVFTPLDELRSDTRDGSVSDAGVEAGHDAGESCVEPLVSCDGRCTDLKADPRHCGRCGFKCSEDEVCDEGTCQTQCGAPKQACGAACVDLAANDAHCGACDRACLAGEHCLAGQCVLDCEAELHQCNKECVDLKSDIDHCGTCSAACVAPPHASAACVEGECRFECADGFWDCNGDLHQPESDGCETALSMKSLTLVSVNALGQPGNAASSRPSISGDGMRVVFASEATNLVSGDLSFHRDIFLRDLALATTERISLGLEAEPNADSWDPVISRNGQVVAFVSGASNLVAGDENQLDDIFVKDIDKPGLERANLPAQGVPASEADAKASEPALSADGRRVAFASSADNLVSQSFEVGQILVRDRDANQTYLVSLNEDGVPGDEPSNYPAFAGSGNQVFFESTAHNLAPQFSVPHPSLYVSELAGPSLTQLLWVTTGTVVPDHSWRVRVSADGQRAVITSNLPELLPPGQDTNGARDVFLLDRTLGSLRIVSRNQAGVLGNDRSTSADISADGELLVFASEATNLVGNDENQASDVFVSAPACGAILRVSRSLNGTEADGESTLPVISGNGRFIAFESTATNLGESASNGVRQIYVAEIEWGPFQKEP